MTPTDLGHCKSIAPIMPTTDVARTVAWYRAAGFAVNVYDGGFVMTKRDDIEIFLSLNPEHDPKRTASCVYVTVDDANALHAKFQAMAVTDLRNLRNTDYRMREFALIDPDGNMMLFGSPLAV
jgi:uncharacterized glyoxalase superfamily protein PhnB